MLLRSGILIAALFALVQSTSAQQAVRGVTWLPPESIIRAEADLFEMQERGITAVRTGPVTDSRLLSAADSAGIVFFRELPFDGYPAMRLADSSDVMMELLHALFESGAGHDSAGPIGLAVRPNSSDLNTCEFLDALKEQISAPPGQEFYYVSAFVESDRCRSSVDFVLIDLVDNPDIRDAVSIWRNSGDERLAILTGFSTTQNAAPGLHSTHSQEWQARSLEESLSEVMPDTLLRGVFVHRWRDERLANIEIGAPRVDLYTGQYGMIDLTDLPRPSMDVVAGYYSGGQTVFAWPLGDGAPASNTWHLLIAWFLIGVVAVLYASSPRFRFMTPRYFMAHGFFRNAVREAREVLPIVSTALLSVVGLTIGMLGTQFLIVIHTTDPVIQLVRWLPPAMHTAVTILTSNPLISVLVLGSFALLLMTIWMAIWMIVAVRRAPLLPSQALMLAVWPRWQLLILLVASMAAFTLESDSARITIVMISVLWLGTSLWASGRTTFDIYKLTRCALWQAVIVWLLNPTVILLLAGIILLISEWDHAAYLIDLAFKS